MVYRGLDLLFQTLYFINYLFTFLSGCEKQAAYFPVRLLKNYCFNPLVLLQIYEVSEFPCLCYHILPVFLTSIARWL